MHTPRWSRRVSRRLSATITATLTATLLATLTACGGGGGDEPQAKPASVDAPHFDLLTVYQQGSSPTETYNRHQLLVIDTAAGQVVRSLDFAYTMTASSPWQAIDAYKTQGTTQATRTGPSMLFLVQNGLVMQTDLRGSSLGSATRISSIQDACGLTLLEGTRMLADGSDAWLSVETAGPDGRCEPPAPADNVWRLVRAGAPASEPGLLVGSSGQMPVTSLQSRPDRLPFGILVVDRGNSRLAVYDGTLTRQLQRLDDGPVVSAKTVVRALYPMPTAPHRQLLRVGNALYLADLSGDQLSLGAPIYTLTSKYTPPPATDGQRLYVIDGQSLIAITASGVATVVSTPSTELGSLMSVGFSGDRLILSLYNSTGITVTSMLTDGSGLVLLSQPGDGNRTTLQAVRDGWAWLSQGPTSSLVEDVIRMRADGSERNVVLSQVRILTNVLNPVLDLAVGQQVDQLLWCQPTSGPVNCAGAALKTLDLRTQQARALGTLPAEGDWSVDYVVGGRTGSLMSGRLAALGVAQTRSLSAGIESRVMPWLVNPDQANSLMAAP